MSIYIVTPGCPQVIKSPKCDCADFICQWERWSEKVAKATQVGDNEIGKPRKGERERVCVSIGPE